MKKMWLILTALVGMLTVASCQRTTGDVSSSDTEAVLQNILQRKSVRSYRSDMPVEKEKVENLLRAGMAAPSGKDKRPWEFIVVDERELLDSLAAHLPYAKMLTSAPMAIVVCGDETKSDYWYLDCSAAAENMLLAAEAQGLGAVWTATYPYRERMEVVSRFLHTPSQIKSLCVIPVGYPMGGQEPKDKWDESRIHYNKWK
ncbi:nitroreductase family protein [Phocaeicola barnesiae]|uniref:Nitroreductase family protein n=1 Tax=Phocaeicola barnesiae TaxID=376804 RepID=A0AAW5N7U3_9BACT|nr:nitroreductase family protein [Phocaeicola barnesiae]MCR8873270.1 nitroreductase family protein [Phocaeicola barnesiae]